MNKSKLRKLAIQHLNKKDVQSIKNQLCEKFTDSGNARREQSSLIIQKKECATTFDASFIKSFISSFKVPEQWNR